MGCYSTIKVAENKWAGATYIRTGETTVWSFMEGARAALELFREGIGGQWKRFSVMLK